MPLYMFVPLFVVAVPGAIALVEQGKRCGALERRLDALISQVKGQSITR